jgi:hypothetical protein
VVEHRCDTGPLRRVVAEHAAVGEADVQQLVTAVGVDRGGDAGFLAAPVRRLGVERVPAQRNERAVVT